MRNKSKVVELDHVVIRFSGDSGDGMQLTGTLFSNTSALMGNDVSNFPDYPAEIRGPSGSVSGVSGFQLQFGRKKVKTPGDYADVLVAMNPAAIKANAKWIKRGGIIITDSDNFDIKSIQKAGYKEDPVVEENLGDFNLIKAPISSLTLENLKEFDLDRKTMLRSKNMFALGIVLWLFDRSLEYSESYFEEKFKTKPIIIKANKKVLEAGYNFAETIEALVPSYKVESTEIEKGTYRNISGNDAVAWGFIAAAEKSGRQLFLGSYPITPASEILVELSKRKDLGVKCFQAEDEIAGICTAIGASFAGSLGVTTTSGPGLALKSEAIGLAVIAELPLVVVNVQRGGPSTGLPTKSEQSDLLQSLYGRNGESPVVVMAASSPSDCFHYTFHASKIALEHMVPVILLTDGFLGLGSEPWKIPKMKDYPDINPPIVKANTKDWMPYVRDLEKHARTWAIPGTPGLKHRIGGLEKDAVTGNPSHVPENHQLMTDNRAEKVRRVQNFIPDVEVYGADKADLLVVGWGGTFGHLLSAVEELQDEKKSISLAHFNYINPLPANTGEVLGRYKKIVVCEINMGQFASYLRMNFPQYEYLQYNKVQGLPFTIIELKECFNKMLEE
ncbi:2-oxoacid:acceptor oxidoreductase subunit alpha [Bacteroidota bacterium]